MKQGLALALTSCLLLGACSTLECFGQGTMKNQSARARDDQPRVWVNPDDSVAAEKSVIEFSAGEKGGWVTWSLVKLGGGGLPSGTRFDDQNAKAIEFTRAPGFDDPRDEITDCGPVKDGTQYQCFNHNRKPGTYKYTIHAVVRGKTQRQDPVMINGGGG